MTRTAAWLGSVLALTFPGPSLAAAWGEEARVRIVRDGEDSAPAVEIDRATVFEREVLGTWPDKAPPVPGVVENGLALQLSFLSVNSPPEGDLPTDLAFSTDGATVVIAHRQSSNLVVLDAATRLVQRVIPLSGSPNSLALSPDGVHAVTANIDGNTASIVDLARGEEVGVVPIGLSPIVARVTPDGTTAVVGNFINSALSIIDIATAKELRRFDADLGVTVRFEPFARLAEPWPFEITADSQKVVVAERFDDRLAFYDIVNGGSTIVPTAPSPWTLALSQDGSTAVLSHAAEPLVSVIDMASQSVARTIAIGGDNSTDPAIAINPAGTKAVVEALGAVRVVNLLTDTVSGDLPSGPVREMAVSADGEHCVLGNGAGTLVSFSSESIVADLLDSTVPDRLRTSPSEPRAVTAHALLGEFAEFLDVDGASGFVEGVVPTGPAPEGDKAHALAVSRDGSVAVVVNHHSDNATIMDLDTRQVSAVVAAGRRPAAVAIAGDGQQAVVANRGSDFATVIDLATAVATDVAISPQASQVVISPDSAFAYVSVLEDDGVWRIDLATLALAGPRVATGDMSAIAIFRHASGMTLSHDGATLITCGSLDDTVSIIDTAGWSEVARVPVGDAPLRAAFSPDDALIYVTTGLDNSVSVVANAGAGSGLLDTIAVGDFPFELALDATGARLYVANFSGRSLSVIDTAAAAVIETIPLPPLAAGDQPIGLAVSGDGSRLYAAAPGNNGLLHVVDTADLAIAATLDIGQVPTSLVLDEASDCVHMPTPGPGDGLATVCVVVESIFSDGFESGDLSAWEGGGQ